jgi:hypothetical protein
MGCGQQSSVCRRLLAGGQKFIRTTDGQPYSYQEVYSQTGAIVDTRGKYVQCVTWHLTSVTTS